MKVSPTPESRVLNTAIIQFTVDDVKKLFAHINAKAAQFADAYQITKSDKLTFGPSYDKKDGYWYGGFQYLEGNPYRVVDTNCP